MVKRFRVLFMVAAFTLLTLLAYALPATATSHFQETWGRELLQGPRCVVAAHRSTQRDTKEFFQHLRCPRKKETPTESTALYSCEVAP